MFNAATPLRFPKTASRLAGIIALASAVVSATPVSAHLDGVAERGDNCTPFAPYQIGAPFPGAKTDPNPIVDEAVLLAGGWRVIGWTITARTGQTKLVPYVLNGTEARFTPGGAPGSYPLTGTSLRGIRMSYDRARQAGTKSGFGAAFIVQIGQFIVAPCFRSVLPKRA